jgi:hypothetical protein
MRDIPAGCSETSLNDKFVFLKIHFHMKIESNEWSFNCHVPAVDKFKIKRVPANTWE